VRYKVGEPRLPGEPGANTSVLDSLRKDESLALPNPSAVFAWKPRKKGEGEYPRQRFGLAEKRVHTSVDLSSFRKKGRIEG